MSLFDKTRNIEADTGGGAKTVSVTFGSMPETLAEFTAVKGMSFTCQKLLWSAVKVISMMK